MVSRRNTCDIEVILCVFVRSDSVSDYSAYVSQTVGISFMTIHIYFNFLAQRAKIEGLIVCEWSLVCLLCCQYID